MLVSCISASLDRGTIWACNTDSVVAFCTLNNVKFYQLAISNTTLVLVRVVLNNGRPMDKHIFLGVVPVDKAIAVFNIEPFNNARDFGSQ